MALSIGYANALAHKLLWEELGGTATGTAVLLPAPMVVASIQFTGTFGSATAKLQVSNDGTNWVDAEDSGGNAVSTTTSAFFDLSNAAVFARVVTSGGSGSDIDATLVIWNV